MFKDINWLFACKVTIYVGRLNYLTQHTQPLLWMAHNFEPYYLQKLSKLGTSGGRFEEQQDNWTLKKTQHKTVECCQKGHVVGGSTSNVAAPVMLFLSRNLNKVSRIWRRQRLNSSMLQHFLFVMAPLSAVIYWQLWLQTKIESCICIGVYFVWPFKNCQSLSTTSIHHCG